MDSSKVQQIIESASSCLKDSRKYRSNSRTKISLLMNHGEKNPTHFFTRLGDNNKNSGHFLASSVSSLSHPPTITSKGLYKIFKNKEQEPLDLYGSSCRDERKQQSTHFEKLKKRSPYSANTVLYDDFLSDDYNAVDNSVHPEKCNGVQHQIVTYKDPPFSRPFSNSNSDSLSEIESERLEMQRFKQARLREKGRKSSYHEIQDVTSTFCHQSDKKFNINKTNSHIISTRERPKTTQNYSTSSTLSFMPASGRSMKERVGQYSEKASNSNASYSNPNSMRHRDTVFSSQDLSQFCSNRNNRDSSSCSSSNCNSTRNIQIKNRYKLDQLQYGDNSEPQFRTHNESNISNEPSSSHLKIHNNYKIDENVDNCILKHHNHTEENNENGSNNNYRQSKLSTRGTYPPSPPSSYCGSDMVITNSKEYPNAITYLRLDGFLKEDYEFLQRHKYHIKVPQYARHPISLSPSQKHVEKKVVRHGPDSNYY